MLADSGFQKRETDYACKKSYIVYSIPLMSTAPETLHSDILPSESSLGIGGSSPFFPIADRETSLSQRAIEEIVALPAMQTLVQAAVSTRQSYTSSSLSRCLGDLHLGIQHSSPEWVRVLCAVKDHLATLNIDIVSASNGQAPNVPESLPSAENIEQCSQYVIPPILALHQKEYPLNALSHRIHLWLASKDLPKSMARSILCTLQETLKTAHGVDVYRPSDRPLSADRNKAGDSRLPISPMETAIDSSLLSGPEKRYAIMILTKVLGTLKVSDSKVSYRGLGVVMGRALLKNHSPAETRFKGDSMRDALLHIVEHLCALEGIAVIGDQNVVYPPVTELRIQLPPQSDVEDDAYSSGDDELDGDAPDQFLDEYEDEDFEELGIRPEDPTRAKPGSEDKVLTLAARYSAGLPLWNPDDCMDHGPVRRLRSDGDADDGIFEQRERSRADQNYAQELEAAKRRSASTRDAARSKAPSESIDVPLDILPEEMADEDDEGIG